MRRWRGGWWEWTTARWVEVEEAAIQAAAYTFTEYAEFIDGDEFKEWTPNRNKIANLLDALAAIVHLPESVSMPVWLEADPPQGRLVSCANGLLELGLA